MLPKKTDNLKSAHDLTEHLGVSISRMSRVIKTMEDKELIQRKTEVTDKSYAVVNRPRTVEIK